MNLIEVLMIILLLVYSQVNLIIDVMLEFDYVVIDVNFIQLGWMHWWTVRL